MTTVTETAKRFGELVNVRWPPRKHDRWRRIAGRLNRQNWKPCLLSVNQTLIFNLGQEGVNRGHQGVKPTRFNGSREFRSSARRPQPAKGTGRF